MSLPESRMNGLSIKLGFWSAFLSVVAFALFPICYIGILVLNGPFTWTDLPSYVAAQAADDQTLRYVAQFAMLAFGALWVVLVTAIHEYAVGEKKVLTRISTYFGILFAGVTGINYFVQVSAVRLSIAKGQLDGLAQFVQGNPTSGVAAINMLGWTLFLGLSTLFLAPVFSGGRLESLIRYSLFAAAIICLLGGAGYVLDNVLVIMLTMNLGMGAALLVAGIALMVLFRRMGRVGVPITPLPPLPR